MMQEEAMRRGERERKQMSDRINNLEHSLASMEAENRVLQVFKHISAEHFT